jgi:ferredoxin
MARRGERRLEMADEIRIDRIRCDGHGLCPELHPELIELDDWGYPLLAPGPVREHLREHARQAVAACPVVALRLERVAAAIQSGRRA